MNIYLIGYRCSGKTSVGKALALLLGWPFLDSDEETVRTAGITISKMVIEKGWNAFRNLEKSVILKTTFLDRHVVATGGGVILNPENIDNMKRAGKIIWLRVSHETAKTRMARDPCTKDQRPALPFSDVFDEGSVFYERQPLYGKACNIAIDSNILEVEVISQKIMEFISE